MRRALLALALPACAGNPSAGIPPTPIVEGGPRAKVVPGPPFLAGLPVPVAEGIGAIARRFLLRFASEEALPFAARHTAALLRESPDADALRAAIALLGRPAPPALLRASVEPDDAEILAKALLDPATVDATVVSMTLARYLAAGAQDRGALVDALRGTDEPATHLLLALGRCGDAEDGPDVRAYLKSETLERRYAAAAACAALGSETAAAWLREVFEKGEPSMRRRVASDLALLRAEGLVGDLLRRASADADPFVAAPAAIALLEAGEKDPAVRMRLDAAAAQVPAAAPPASILRAIRHDPPAVGALTFVALYAFDAEARVEAALLLARARNPLPALFCRFGLDHGDLPVTCLAGHALATLERPAAVFPSLLRRIAAGEGAERAGPAFALGEIGGRAAVDSLATTLEPRDPALAAAYLGAAGLQSARP